MSWKVAAESAKAWLSKPDEDRLARMREAALAMTDAVPAAQKDAWVKLMKGLAREDDPKRKERAQALVRACRLFGGPAKMAKSSQKQADFAIDWRAPVDVLPGIGPQLRETLAESNVIAVADLLFQLPTRYDARRAPISLA
ncbi:MAG: hypothetical protein ACRELY_02395, partial [Polyangiaceae bacterium]